MTDTAKRKIRITIRPYATIMQDVIDTCEKIEQVLTVSPADPELNFADAATMLSTLSEKRMELLMYLHQHGPLNIRQLAKSLKRDYSNVHTDVKLLLRLGLLASNANKQVFVPWDELTIELPLAA